MITFTIRGRLPGLNEYINACRNSKYQGAKMKREAEDLIALFVKKISPLSGPVSVGFVWHEKNRRRDPDNVASAQKFILDTLVKLKKLPNDNAAYIKEIRHWFHYGTDYSVTVMLQEINAPQGRKELVWQK